MISFIVIGRNEGWKLEKCLSSIKNLIEFYDLKGSETIYVDSNSSDGSVALACRFKNIQVFKLSQHFNAAIARNIGAKYSKGNILFFLDGDMEFISHNFKKLFNSSMNELIYPFISADFLNHYYSDNISKIKVNSAPFHNLNEISIEVTTGGLFAIERKLWQEVKGMRHQFRRSQDLDLGLRLARLGIPLHRMPCLLVIHHTVKYTDSHRFWADLIKGNFLYRGLLIRKNLFNKYIIKVILLREITNYSLFISIFLILYFANWRFIFIYFLITFLKVVRRSKLNHLFRNLLQSIIVDLSTIFSFLLFYPKIKPYKVTKYK